MNGVPHVQSREFDEFDRYDGSSPHDVDDGLKIFQGSGLCPDITVEGVPLQYNESHSEVMVKIKQVQQLLDNFGEKLPEGVEMEPSQRLQALRALSFQEAKEVFTPYWHSYDQQMQTLADARPAVTAEFEFRALPVQQSSELSALHKLYLELLLDVSEAKRYSDFKLADAPSEPGKGTEAAALLQLAKAVKLHGEGTALRNKFQAQGVKLLRYKGTARATDVPEWDSHKAKVGDLVLVKVESTGQPWEIGIILDPVNNKDNTGELGLHIPAGVPGHQKVRVAATASMYMLTALQELTR